VLRENQRVITAKEAKEVRNGCGRRRGFRNKSWTTGAGANPMKRRVVCKVESLAVIED